MSWSQDTLSQLTHNGPDSQPTNELYYFEVTLFYWPVHSLLPVCTEIRTDRGPFRPKIAKTPALYLHEAFRRGVRSFHNVDGKAHLTVGTHLSAVAVPVQYRNLRVWLTEWIGTTSKAARMTHKSISFWSRFLTDAKCAYDIALPDCLVAVKVVMILHPYF